MKTLVLSMISIAATVAAMTACTSESDPIDEVVNPKDAKVEIKLNTGVGNITTKADPVTNSSNIQVSLIREDVTSPSTPTWTSATPQNYTLSNTIALTGDQKYFDNEGKASYFMGYYPTSGNKQNTTVTFSNMNGETDIICATPINAGTKSAPATNETLSFKHMLSQIEIAVKGTTSSNTTFGKVKKISLLNIPSNLDLSLTNQTVSENDTPNANNIDFFVTASEGEYKDITELVSIPTKFILAGYGTSSKKLTIQIETTNFNTELSNARTVTIDNITTSGQNAGTLAGYKHKITLTFNDNISIDTTIEEINPDGGESGGNIGEE